MKIASFLFPMHAIKKILLKPLTVDYCSQTVYRTLMGCISLWDATRDKKWMFRASHAAKILMEIQRPDGGFDNGYDYNFGFLHKKGESLSSELVGLLALVEYYKRSFDESVIYSIKNAANWIRKNSIRVSEYEYAIPYGPYSSKAIIVLNGTSFAAGALGSYLSVFPDEELEKIYLGFIKFLHNRLNSSHDNMGKFWYYFVQDDNSSSNHQRDKVDFYHQMQQVEVHAYAELNFPSKDQKTIVQLASDFVLHKQNELGLIPYTNSKEYFGSEIHLWGFSSCAAGFIMASKSIINKSNEYRQCASKILDWIKKNAWNGNYFYNIVPTDGIILDKRLYVRSEAWVFSVFSLAVKENISFDVYLDICEKSYNTILHADFSGIENHATNNRIRFFRGLRKIVLNIK